MSKLFASITKPFSAPLWIPLVASCAALLLAATGLFLPWDRSWSDFLIRTRISAQPLPQSPRIFPIDLTDTAERNLGANLDSRQAFADLFTVLGDGKLSGGMDFLFSGSATPEGDAAMVAAAAKMDGLVIAVVPVDKGTNKFSFKQYTDEEAAVVRSHLWHPTVKNAGRIPEAETFLLPNLALAKASRSLGHIGVKADNDGIYRRVALFFRFEDGYMPSLPLAMAAYSQKFDTSQVVIDAGNEVTLTTKKGVIHIPVDIEGYTWIPFPSTWAQGWKRLQMDTVANAATDTELEDEMLNILGDGMVVVADLTTSHKDFGTTPIEAIYPLSGIHTSVLNGIVNQTFYRSVSLPEVLVLLVLLALGIGYVCTRKTELLLHAGFLALALLVLAWSVAAWWLLLMIPWFATPMVALLFAWGAALVLRLQKNHEERALLENTLSRYFPKALASRVRNTDLKPAEKELSIMFSDISGFTKWSSDKPADLVHSFLSAYLGSMSVIIFSHGGTVDKFMGDGILAFFGDPFDQPDHAERCVNAAIAMQARVKELQVEWGEKAKIELKIRIGINTGRVIVGDLGSDSRMEYTVIGSAVNLAQRMESNAPLEGILVTGNTHEKVKDKYTFSPKEVKVKGYDEGIAAWVVEGKR